MKKTLTLLTAFLLTLGANAQKAVALNGTDGRVVIDSTAFSLVGGTAITYATWLNADLAQNNRYIFDFSDSAGFAAGTNGMRMMLLNTYNNFQRTSNLGFYFYFNQNNPPVLNSVVTGLSGQWLHYAVVINQTANSGGSSTYDIIAYVNGAESARTTKTITHADPAVRALRMAPASNLKLGARYDNRVNNFLLGKLDDFVVFNRALTPAEIEGIVCNGALPSTGRILYYAFEENRGTSAIDSSQTSAHGTLRGGATWASGISGGIGSTPPVVGFTSITTNPSLVVAYNDTSKGGNIRVWYFGDGDSSTLKNPTHTYARGGRYNVCLKVTNSCGVSAQTCREVNVVCPPAVASFVKTVVDKKVTFEADTNGATYFTWDFGDGSPLLGGTDKGTVSKIFSTYKNYKVCLYVESPCGMDTTCETIFIAVAGTEDRNHQSMLRVYPNPASQNLTIETTEASEFSARILDISGREMMRLTALKSGQQIDITSLQAGNYVLEVQSGELIERIPVSVR